MTLVITVATEKSIYQCADYRLKDLLTGHTYDFKTQKIFHFSKKGWSATVCFAGIGRTPTVDVSAWLSDLIESFPYDATFEDFLAEVAKADNWINSGETVDRRHSFSIAAFVGIRAEFALLSNFESLSEEPLAVASARLMLYRVSPTKPVVFISGQRQAVPRPTRRRLRTLAERNPNSEAMFVALAEANREASVSSSMVSPGCFLAYVNHLGQGGGRPHATGDVNLPAPVPGAMSGPITALLDSEFGPGRHRIRQFVTARSDANDEFHKNQIAAKPNDPDAHTNYGAYLLNEKKDSLAAEALYRRALELDANHGNALGNLANLVAASGQHADAADLYRRAIRAKGGNENASFNFARFLFRDLRDASAALETLEAAVVAHPQSQRLQLALTERLFGAGRVREGMESLELARPKGADQAQVEAAFAIGLHLGGAPIAECIGAYRTAISLAPKIGGLRLNLSQLLFLIGDDQQARNELNQAMTAGLEPDAQLEALLYRLCHLESDPELSAKQASSLVELGARLKWDVSRNIKFLKSRDPKRAALSEKFVAVMTGSADLARLDRAVDEYRA